jgi:hypothetical protein
MSITSVSPNHHLNRRSLESALVYLSRGGEDSRDNVAILCPTHHTVVHKADAPFDHGRLAFLFPNGRVEPLCLNRHLTARQG